MTDVVMPQMGESIVEGTLTKWLKKAGETVERDEPLFEISTDKVDTEIPAPASGVLAEVVVQEGQTVGVNAVVARINEGGNGAGASAAPAAEAPAPAPPPAAAPPPPPAPAAAAPAPPPPPAAPAPVATAAPVEVSAGPAGPLSPLVRKMARENNIDLSKVSGTGAGGRIVREDVDAYLKAQASPAATAPAPAAPPAAPAQISAVAQPAPTARTRVEPMSNMRQKIAEHMVMSKRTSAHVTTVHRVDMTRVAKMRAKH